MKRLLQAVTCLFLLFLLTDASSQWQRQYPMEELEDVLDIAMHQDGHGYAVGHSDLILKLDPMTQTWDLLTSWDMDWSFEAVDYADGTNGAVVAAGGDGLILSTNGGMNWMEINGAPAGIVAVQVTSATEILVIAASGVFKWENDTWTDLNLPVAMNVKGGHILDTDHIYVFTQFVNVGIYATANGGGDWSVNTDITSPDVLRFFDAQYGVAVDGRKIYQSHDGGVTWTEVSSGEVHSNPQDLAFGENAGIMMAATSNGEPSISQDSGKTWTNYDMGTINTKNASVSSSGDNEFWVGNDVSSITRTTDGGATWIETSGPERQILYATHFFNRNAGMSVGTDGVVIRTFDGGTHWEELDNLLPNPCFSVYGLTQSDVWVGANKAIYHTTDMGDTWEEKLSLLGGSVNDIAALSASRILVTTTTGLILRTTDGGEVWDTAYMAPSQLRSIRKIDNNRVMATGYNGLILKSIDQGDTWTEITPPEANLQYEQTYFIGEEGWMVTSSFKKVMWHTSDAGDSWTPIDLPIERFWESLYFISPDTGIVAGRNNQEGRVYTTFDGGMSWQSGYITSFPIYDVTGFPNPNGTAWICGFGSDIEVLPYCNSLPSIADFTGDLNPCQGDTVLYTVSGDEVTQFSWLFPNGWQPVSDTNNDSVWVKAGINTGVISVTGSNPCGISETINNNAVSQPLPQISNFTGEANPCEGAMVTYAVTGVMSDSYAWSFPGDWVVLTDPSLASVTVEIGTEAGTISVTASNACGSSQALTQMVSPIRMPVVNSVSGEIDPCQGRVVTYTADANHADSFVWSIPADWQVTGALNEAMLDVMVGAEAGDVTVVGQNTCGITPETALSVAPKPAPPVSIIQNGNMLSLSSTGISYQWYMNGEIIDGATEDTYTATASGVYHAVVEYDNGCQSTAPQLAVFVTSTGDIRDITSISIYPNPVSNELYLRDIEGAIRYQIIDFTGKMVANASAMNSSVGVSTLSNGVYVIRIEQNDQIYQGRFVVLK